VVLEQVRSLAGVPAGPFNPQAGDGAAPPQQLGDYRSLREVGRGGMGVVYEAVQESLGRHVALKILPFHRLMEPTRLERFKREARAAAQLHHTNIVPVFGIGEAEGVHYYAMQFIEGHGLDTVLEEVRTLRGGKSGTAVEGQEKSCDLSRSLAQSLLTGRFEEAPEEREAAAHEVSAERAVPCPFTHSGHSSSQSEDSLLLREVRAALALQERALPRIATEAKSAARDTITAQSDLASQTEWQYCRSVAQVGVQVAEALAYAHKQRILMDETAAFPDRGFEWYYWQRLCRGEHLRLVGHRGGLNAVAFAPDGQRLVTGGNDGTARVWDATSGQELSCLRGHRSQVMDVAFAPDGHWLVTGGMDGTARIWDIAGGRELRKLQGQHTGPILAVAVTPDGKRVVTGSEDGLARVWDGASGQELITLQGPTPLPMFGASMVGLLSSPHQRAFLAVTSLYPRRTGHTGAIWTVAVMGDGRRLVTGSQDQTARVWDLATVSRWCNALATPKSITLATSLPSWMATSTFDGLMSRWMIPF
jgi:hypothetical protein